MSEYSLNREIAALEAELERVKAERDEAKGNNIAVAAAYADALTDLDQSRAECARLRAREEYLIGTLKWIIGYCECPFPRSCDCSNAHQDVAREALKNIDMYFPVSASPRDALAAAREAIQALDYAEEQAGIEWDKKRFAATSAALKRHFGGAHD